MERIVTNCLDTIVKNGLKSISFPALGTGRLKYPTEIVARTMVSTCYNYLRYHECYGLSINIVISEEYREILKVG